MKILLCNDDGVHANGILTLFDELSLTNNDIVMVAPDRNKSGASSSITISKPIRARKIKDNIFAVQGTPVDCVHVAVTGILDSKPDLVISGINEGANVGPDVFYSGTIGVATEATYLGIPSIAFSLNGKGKEAKFTTAAKIAKNIVDMYVNGGLKINTILNVNVPNIKYSDIQGYDITKIGKREKDSIAVKDTDIRGREMFWYGLPADGDNHELGTDIHSIKSNRVSITPLVIDMTNYKSFEYLKKVNFKF